MKKTLARILSLFIIGFMFISNVGVVWAASSETFKDLIDEKIIIGIISPVTKLLIALAIVFFLWGVFKFMIQEGDKKEEGREFMFWGIIGIFVMVSVWGLVNILVNTFNLDGTGGLDVPDTYDPGIVSA